jgi:2-C-methyl-D-erythritol 4-phosphate cytidylyltransferase
VLVHDAARPFVPDDVIERVVAAAREGSGALPALPVVDTLKEVDDGGGWCRTVDRAPLWRAQTPQGFPARCSTRRTPGRAGRASRPPTTPRSASGSATRSRSCLGDERAMKVTEAGDFARAEALSILPA